MDTVVALVLGGFAGLMGLAVTIAIRRSRGFRRAVRRTAEALGLEVEPGGLMRSPRAHGQVDGLVVEVRHVRERDRRRRKRRRDREPILLTRVRVSGGWREELAARPRDEARARGLLETLNLALRGASEIVSGDPHLDDGVLVRAADRFDTVSRLGAETRAHLSVLVGDQGGDVRDGVFTLKRRGLVTDPETLEAMTRAAIDLGRGLSRAGRRAEAALADIVRDDPVPAVRVSALEQLVAERPHYRETAAAVTAALAPGDPTLRALAAANAGEEGFDAARDVATDAGAPRAARRVALQLLGTRYPGRREEAAAALDAALASADDELIDVDLRAAAALGHRPDLDALGAVAPRVGAASAATFTRALTRHGPAAERLLLGLLEVDDGEVRVVTAEALGRVGTLGAVEPLLPHTTGVFRSRALKSAAREAVAAIQARGGGGAVGGLSLAEDLTGELSLADEE